MRSNLLAAIDPVVRLGGFAILVLCGCFGKKASTTMRAGDSLSEVFDCDERSATTNGTVGQKRYIFIYRLSVFSILDAHESDRVISPPYRNDLPGVPLLRRSAASGSHVHEQGVGSIDDRGYRQVFVTVRMLVPSASEVRAGCVTKNIAWVKTALTMWTTDLFAKQFRRRKQFAATGRTRCSELDQRHDFDF